MRIDGRATLTLPEAARWLELTVPCVSALIARGELPSLRDPDEGVRISAAALIEWAGSADAVAPRAPRSDLPSRAPIDQHQRQPMMDHVQLRTGSVNGCAPGFGHPQACSGQGP